MQKPFSKLGIWAFVIAISLPWVLYPIAISIAIATVSSVGDATYAESGEAIAKIFVAPFLIVATAAGLHLLSLVAAGIMAIVGMRNHSKRHGFNIAALCLAGVGTILATVIIFGAVFAVTPN